MEDHKFDVTPLDIPIVEALLDYPTFSAMCIQDIIREIWPLNRVEVTDASDMGTSAHQSFVLLAEMPKLLFLSSVGDCHCGAIERHDSLENRSHIQREPVFSTALCGHESDCKTIVHFDSIQTYLVLRQETGISTLTM
jgi:hypothetical protein